MKLINNVMKSILAVALIAAMSACSMGGIANTSAAEAAATINVGVDTGRTALPNVVVEAFQDTAYFELSGTLSDQDPIDVTADGLTALNAKLASIVLSKGEWTFDLTVDVEEDFKFQTMFTAKAVKTIAAIWMPLLLLFLALAQTTIVGISNKPKMMNVTPRPIKIPRAIAKANSGSLVSPTLIQPSWMP